MKDNNSSATHITEQNFPAHVSTASRQMPAPYDFNNGGKQSASKAIENDKINRRYSFDDNGGGYLGL
jgi:hypothetical protein